MKQGIQHDEDGKSGEWSFVVFEASAKTTNGQCEVCGLPNAPETLAVRRSPSLMLSNSPFLACVLTAVMLGCSQRQLASDQTTQLPLAAIPSGRVDLGEVGRGQQAAQTIAIQNMTPSVQHISRLESSCACVRILPNEIAIDGFSRGHLTVELDLASEPAFTGELAIEINGYGAESRRLFTLTVLASVASGEGDAAAMPTPVPTPMPIPHSARMLTRSENPGTASGTGAAETENSTGSIANSGEPR